MTEMKTIWVLIKILFLPIVIVFWIIRTIFKLSASGDGKKNHPSPAPSSSATNLAAFAVGALAAKKAYGLSTQPIVSTKTPEKVQIHAVNPRGNHWIVYFSYWYSDTVKWTKSERKISRGTRGISAGSYWIDVDWR
jgi:hypothetical protein